MFHNSQSLYSFNCRLTLVVGGKSKPLAESLSSAEEICEVGTGKEEATCLCIAVCGTQLAMGN